MAVTRRKSDGRGDTSVRDAARAILELAQPNHVPAESPRCNDQSPKTKSAVRKGEPTHQRLGMRSGSCVVMRQSRVVHRPNVILVRSMVPQPIRPLDSSFASFPAVIPIDDMEKDENCTLQYRPEDSRECDSDSRFPPIQFRNYKEDSHIPGDIGNIATAPLVGKPLSRPPRLPFLGRQNHFSPASFSKSVLREPKAKCLSRPPSLIHKIPTTVKFPRPSKD